MASAGVDVTVQAGIRPARFASVNTVASPGSPSGRSRPMFYARRQISSAASVAECEALGFFPGASALSAYHPAGLMIFRP